MAEGITYINVCSNSPSTNRDTLTKDYYKFLYILPIFPPATKSSYKFVSPETQISEEFHKDADDVNYNLYWHSFNTNNPESER